MIRLILFMAACASGGLWLFCIIMELSAIKQIRAAAMEAGERNIKLSYKAVYMFLLALFISVVVGIATYPW